MRESDSVEDLDPTWREEWLHLHVNVRTWIRIVVIPTAQSTL